jgi:hypothetical protein
MPEKITNIGCLKIFRYYEECPVCGNEMDYVMMYGYVCFECDSKDSKNLKEDINDH